MNTPEELPKSRRVLAAITLSVWGALAVFAFVMILMLIL